MAGTTMALALMMSIQLLPDRVSLKLGDVASRDLSSPRTVVYVNTEATSRLQQAALLSTPSVYDSVINAPQKAERSLTALFDTFSSARKQLPLQGSAVTPLRPLSLSQSQHILSLPQSEFEALQLTARMITADAMLNEIRDDRDDLSRALKDVANSANIKLSDMEAGIVTTLARAVVSPTKLLNTTKTEQAKEAAAHLVKPVYEPISRGDKLITRGDRVSQEQLDKLTALGLMNPRLELAAGLAVWLLAITMVALVSVYITRVLPKLHADHKRLTLLTVIVLLSLAGLKVSSTMLGLQFSSGQLGYLSIMSVTAAGMLVSVMLDRSLAVLIIALLSAQSGLQMNHEIRYTVMSLLSSIAGIISVGSARNKSNLSPQVPH